MLKWTSYSFFLLISVLFIQCSSPSPTPLYIATSANVQFAMEELVDTFTLQTGIDCEIVLGSSGKLTAQIMQGAPYDIFVSANMIYPNTLFDHGFSIDPPRIYAYGSLVLWSVKDNLKLNIDDLDSTIYSNIAIPNPKTAPYGTAAIQALTFLGLYDQVKPKLVYGESISQTNQFIISQTVDAGFSAKSVVLSPNIKDRGTWIDVPIDSYKPIEQGVVVLQKGTIKPKAQQFYEFLFSSSGMRILEKYGYKTNG